MLTTVAIAHVRERPGRRLADHAVERRGVPRLPDDAVRTRPHRRPQDRADVVRILDAVEDDEERRGRRRRGDQLRRRS